jgi:membrane protease YdiL (CAAX protease family)
VSAALFAAIHQSFYVALPLFILGAALAMIYERTGSLAAPVATHAVFNGLQLVTILLSRGGAPA